MSLDYVLIDMNTVRSARLIERALAAERETVNKDGVTSFTWITFEELAQAGAILSLDLELPTRHAIATPLWYRRHCDALGRAIRAKQLTEAEATFELDFWHAVCMRLPWPDGWHNNGQIRIAA